MKIKKCKIDCFQKSCILLCMALFSCSQYDCVVPDNGKTGEGERASLGIGGVSTGRLEVLTRSVTAVYFEKKIPERVMSPFITESIRMELHFGRQTGKRWC